jgi:hypothetical protein
MDIKKMLMDSAKSVQFEGYEEKDSRLFLTFSIDLPGVADMIVAQMIGSLRGKPESSGQSHP